MEFRRKVKDTFSVPPAIFLSFIYVVFGAYTETHWLVVVAWMSFLFFLWVELDGHDAVESGSDAG